MVVRVVRDVAAAVGAFDAAYPVLKARSARYRPGPRERLRVTPVRLERRFAGFRELHPQIGQPGDVGQPPRL